MTEPLFGSTAPVFEIDGALRGELARDLLRLEVAEDRGGMKRLSASFVAQGAAAGSAEQLLYLDGAILDFGRSIKVSIGFTQVARTVFDGVISAIELTTVEGAPPQVAICAEDALMRLRLSRGLATYENMSDADIVRAVAGRHGLAAQVDVDGPTYDRVQQWNQSDLAFLRERARLLQADLWFADGSLHCATRERRQATAVSLLRSAHLLSIQARADLAHQRGVVRVSGYDAGERDMIDEQAGEDAVLAETAGGRNGVALVRQVFGEAASLRVRAAPLADAEARAWARAELLRRARGFVRVCALARGVPDLVVGSALTLGEVGAPFDGGGYTVTSVLHSYDLEQGHRTRFEAERPTLGAAA